MSHIPAPGEVYYSEDGTTSVVLADSYNPNYEPSEQELHEYAEYIGIDWHKEPELLHVAKEGLQAPLPHGWRACQTSDNELYYFNFVSGESLWDHPLDALFRKRVVEEREKIKERNGKKISIKVKNNKRSIDREDNHRVETKNELPNKVAFPTGNRLRKLNAISPIMQTINPQTNATNASIPPTYTTTTSTTSFSTASPLPLPLPSSSSPFYLSPLVSSPLLPMTSSLSAPLSMQLQPLSRSHLAQSPPLGVKDIEANIRKRVDDEYAMQKKKLNLEYEQQVEVKQAEIRHRVTQLSAENAKKWQIECKQIRSAAEKRAVSIRTELEEEYKSQIELLEQEIGSIASEIRQLCYHHQEHQHQQQQRQQQQQEQQREHEQEHQEEEEELNTKMEEYQHELQTQLNKELELLKVRLAKEEDEHCKYNEEVMRELRERLARENENKLNYIKRQSQNMIQQLENKVEEKRLALQTALHENELNEEITQIPNLKEDEEENKQMEETQNECEMELESINNELDSKIALLQSNINLMKSRVNNKIEQTNKEKQKEENTLQQPAWFCTLHDEEQIKEIQHKINIESNKFVTALKTLENKHERQMREIRQFHDRKLYNACNINSESENNNRNNTNINTKNTLPVFDPRKISTYNTSLTQRKRAWLQAHPAEKYELWTLPSSYLSSSSYSSSSSSCSASTVNNKPTNYQNVNITKEKQSLLATDATEMMESEKESEVDEEEIERAVQARVCEAKQTWAREYETELVAERGRHTSELNAFREKYRKEQLEKLVELLAKEEEEKCQHNSSVRLNRNEEVDKQIAQTTLREHEKCVEDHCNYKEYYNQREQLQEEINKTQEEINKLETEKVSWEQTHSRSTHHQAEQMTVKDKEHRLEQQVSEHSLEHEQKVKTVCKQWNAIVELLQNAIYSEKMEYESLQAKNMRAKMRTIYYHHHHHSSDSTNLGNTSSSNNNNNNAGHLNNISDRNNLRNMRCSETKRSTPIYYNDSDIAIEAEVSIANHTPVIATPIIQRKEFTRIPLGINSGLINSSRKNVYDATTVQRSRSHTPHEAVASSRSHETVLELNKPSVNRQRQVTIHRDPLNFTLLAATANQLQKGIDNNLYRSHHDLLHNGKEVDDVCNNYTSTTTIKEEGANSAINHNSTPHTYGKEILELTLSDKLRALQCALRERRTEILQEQAELKRLRAEWTEDLHMCKLRKDKHQAYFLQAVKIKLEEYAHLLNEKVLALKEAKKLLRVEKIRYVTSKDKNETAQQLMSIANDYLPKETYQEREEHWQQE